MEEESCSDTDDVDLLADGFGAPRRVRARGCGVCKDRIAVLRAKRDAWDLGYVGFLQSRARRSGRSEGRIQQDAATPADVLKDGWKSAARIGHIDFGAGPQPSTRDVNAG